MRTLAICKVVLDHGAYFLEGTPLEGFPFFNMIDGVDIFFALSGYLIGKILLREINENAVFGFKDLLHFWKRRWFRTLPNYYLILLANYVVVKYQVIHEFIENFNWKFFVFLQNFSTPFMGFFWESWSLTVEEWFYIVMPILLLLLLRFTKPKAGFLIAALVMVAGPVLHRIVIYNPAIDGNQLSEITHKLVLNRLDSIAYGLLGAWLFYYYGALWHKLRYYSFALGLALMYFVLHYFAEIGSFYTQVVMFTLSPLSTMLLLPLAESIRHVNGFFARVVTHISIISYSMYLINMALVSEVIRDNFAPTGTNDRLFKYGIYWLCVIVFSTLLYKFYEKPMMDLRDRTGKRKSED